MSGFASFAGAVQIDRVVLGGFTRCTAFLQAPMQAPLDNEIRGG
jgi:hypothetical protein